MKLINVQIQHFRNIIDSGEVDVDDRVTCLVGKNESGKTSFLHALYRLLPARPNVSFDAPSQYPAWLEKKHRQGGINIDGVEPATAVFKVEPEDQRELDEQFGPGAFISETVTVTRSYSGRHLTSFITDEAKAVAWAISNVSLPKPYSDKKRGLKNFPDLLRMIEKMRHGNESPDSKVKLGASELQKNITAMIGDQDFQHAVQDVLTNQIPRFFYFSEYSSLPYSVNIQELLNTDEGDLEDDELTTLSLLRMAASDDDYLLNPDYELRKRELENVGNALTSDVLQYWSQNPDLRVDMDITKEQITNPQNQSIAVLDELKIRIRDSRHWLTLPFDEHSTGFQWFFSFLAAFSKFEWDKQPLVILLDEPALGLHARAQKDFLRFINERLAVDKRQVIYSTHSPFMIEPDRLERARVVEDHGREVGSTVSSDILTTDTDTLFPLQAALGYDIAQHLFIGARNLVVEGTSDFTYLTVISDYLKEQGRVALDDRWSVLPVGGIDLIPTFVALLGHHLDVTVVIDATKKGHQKLSRLAKEGFLEHQRIIPVGNVIDRPDADIEDLFSVEDYLGLYNQTFSKEIAVQDLQGTDRIVNKIARHEGVDEFDHGRPADILLRNRDRILPKLSTGTLEQFEQLNILINETMISN
ncbi:MAG: AAA family ATPase [Candidatus Sedimenticola sp. (ex Thyasira tokunagai)]